MEVLHSHQIEVIEKMMRCGESGDRGLGYHKYACPDHPEKTRIVPHTCKTKVCTSCATIRNDIWAEELKQRLPGGKYFHVTLTMPEEFRKFFHRDWNHDWMHMNNLYNLGWQVIRGYFKNQHHILTGAVIVLHTFGRDMKINPHLHLIVPAGGLDYKKDLKKWKKLNFLSEKYLKVAWKQNLLEYVLEHTPYFQTAVQKLLRWAESETPEAKKKLISYINTVVPPKEREMWQKVCTVDYYLNISQKENFNNTISYIARYSRRLPISKSKILGFSEDAHTVTWQYQPHHKNENEVTITLDADDFIDRFIRHIPPKHFRLVRFYGFLASKNIKKFDFILRKVCKFDSPKNLPSWRERQFIYLGEDPLICPCCYKEMELVKKTIWDQGSQKIIEIPLKKV